MIRQTLTTTFMNYECPSCYLEWKDSSEPLNNICYPLCPFCSLKHSQKELLNWQMDHIENLNKSKLPKLYRHFYRFVELEINLLKDKLNDQICKKESSNN